MAVRSPSTTIFPSPVRLEGNIFVEATSLSMHSHDGKDSA